MNQSDDISWFHPKKTRQEAEKLLLEDPRKINGLFLVRESISSPNDYVLSVLCDNQVHNYQIRSHQEDAFFSISINEVDKFHGLESVIEHYKINPLSEEGLCLTEYVKGSLPPHQTRRSGSSNLLHRATNEGDYMVVTELLHSGYPGSDAKNQDGKTAVHIAAIKGDNDILKKLILHRVNVNCRDTKGVTPLHYACMNNLPETAKLLVTTGKANIQARNTENGEVPLHVAASAGHLEIIKVLLALNAPLRPRTKSGLTPTQLARNNGHAECAKYLDAFKCPMPTMPRDQFYHGTLDRHEAEEKIRQFKPESGTFLVRYSDRKSLYILTVFHEKVYNFLIREKDEFLFIDDGPLLNSLEHLVDYYRTLSDGLPTVLSTPVPPPKKPPQPPISTLKKRKDQALVKNTSFEDSFNDIPNSNILQRIAFKSDLNLASDNNNQSGHTLIEPYRLKRGTIIGQGEFAMVYKGTFKQENGVEIPVAIKTIRNADIEGSEKTLQKEAEVMMKLNHKCIVKLYGICPGPALQLVQELVPLGSILQYICSNKSLIDPDFEFRIWATQIAAGMHYLEENHFVHRDLAARNVLLSTKYQAKISDFGLSRAIEEAGGEYRASQGGRWPVKWYAPESYKHGQFGHKSDVWSFGVTLWEMYSYGLYPYGDMKGVEAMALIDRGERLLQPPRCPDKIYKVMLKCWEYEKEKRPTFKELEECFKGDHDYQNIRELVPELARV